ncbi:tumor necrosis factor ligand superfamily member 18 [Megalops cyprinoides]|uniref:tumor necrosis factor ligand superfamily member 18 n=1 Tax=Megalops cyprinoides TaxID=118141 RepID=UPI001864C936|nr:tumor necrosis factor ligand superfamily member 18 [Megalops cyprinoides]
MTTRATTATGQKCEQRGYGASFPGKQFEERDHKALRPGQKCEQRGYGASFPGKQFEERDHRALRPGQKCEQQGYGASFPGKQFEEHDHRASHPGQRWLVRVLLVWVALLSVSQAVSLTLLLTPALSTEKDLQSIPGREFTVDYHSRGADSRSEVEVLRWTAEDGAVSSPKLGEPPEHLLFMQDGRYFLYTQVTLQSGVPDMPHTVRVRTARGKLLLESRVTRGGTGEPFTTGLLGRQVQLSAGDSLSVTCYPPALINTTTTATYLGVYLLEPQHP